MYAIDYRTEKENLIELNVATPMVSYIRTKFSTNLHIFSVADSDLDVLLLEKNELFVFVTFYVGLLQHRIPDCKYYLARSK